jgi:membrane-bound lytic murein transglycosylase B
VPVSNYSISVFVLLLLWSSTCPYAAGASFDSWKQGYAARASKRGLSRRFVLKTLASIKPDQKVVKKDKNQVVLNKKIDYRRFIKQWLRDGERVAEGKKQLKANLSLLRKIEKAYGVDKEVIISLWGVETLYGKINGDYNVIRSLATLAHHGRRRKFYETQLNAALRLVRKGHVKVKDLKGSWAGATGQCQFMPSNIPVYGQDFDGDGKIDIWNSKADIFASIANLLKKGGWRRKRSIGSLALNTMELKFFPDEMKSKKELHQLGIRQMNGQRLRSPLWNRRKVATIPMDNSPVVLRGTNYAPILKWNNSSLFAAFNILLMKGIKRR